MPDLTTLERFINGVGLSTAILVAAMYAIYRFLSAATPMVRLVAEKHLELIDTLKAGTEKLTDSVSAIQESSTAHSRRISEICATLEGHGEIARHAANAIEELAGDDARSRVKPHTDKIRDTVASSRFVREELRRHD